MSVSCDSHVTHSRVMCVLVSIDSSATGWTQQTGRLVGHEIQAG